MTKIVIYLFGHDAAQTVATRTYDDGSWYMADDICRLLGIVNHSLAVSNHVDEDDACKKTIHIGGYGKKRVLMVNNTGLLKLIEIAKSDRAKPIREKAKNTPHYLKPALWPAELDLAA